MLNRDFATRQAQRFEIFEGFPKVEWSEAAFLEYVNALMRCQNEPHCREVVTHFVETATKYPPIAVVLSQIRITTPINHDVAKKCPRGCVNGFLHGWFLVDSPGAPPQTISQDEAVTLMARIRVTKGCRSMVYEGAYACGCRPIAAPGAPEPERAGMAKVTAREAARAGRQE